MQIRFTCHLICQRSHCYKLTVSLTGRDGGFLVSFYYKCDSNERVLERYRSIRGIRQRQFEQECLRKKMAKFELMGWLSEGNLLLRVRCISTTGSNSRKHTRHLLLLVKITIHAVRTKLFVNCCSFVHTKFRMFIVHQK